MAQSSEIKLLKRFDQNVEITGTITTGSIVNIAENTQPTMTFIHSGNNPGTNDLIGQIIFQADYDGSPQTWAGIYVDTNANSVRTDMDFLVKSTSGNLETGLKIQGGASTPKAFFYNDVDIDGVLYADSVRVTNIVTNKIVKFDGTDLDDSIMTDNGTTVTVAGNFNITLNDVGVTTNYGTASIEATDAQLDIISSSSGTWGSAINLVEGTSSTANTNIWSIARQTSSAGNLLRFNFGTGNQHDNAAMMSLSTGGNLTLTGTLSASGYNKSNWDTAYGWGNHASAGYADSSDVNKAIARSLGWVPAYSTTNENAVFWNESEQAVELYSATDSSIGMSLKAVRVKSGDKLRFTTMVKGSSANSDGLYLRLYAHHGDMPDGKTHVSNGSGDSSPYVQEDNSGVTNWVENGAITTGWVTYEYTYTAPADGYVSLVVLNWGGFGLGRLYVKQPDIQFEKVNGATNAGYATSAGNADTLDGYHASSFLTSLPSHTHDDRYYTESESDTRFTKRVDLTSQIQLNSYRKSVIALCDVNNTDISRNSYSIGTLAFHRSNGLSAPVKLDIAIEKRYNANGPNVVALGIGGDSFVDNIQYVTFDYNGNTYGGIEFYFTAAQHHYVTFHGESNFSIFGVDYYNTSTGDVLNTEINNSLSTSSVSIETDFFFNNNQVWHAGNDGSGSGLDADTVDGLEASQFFRSDVDDTISGKPTFAKGSSGNLASRTGYNDFLGYNPSYGSYIGGGANNAVGYLYAGGYYHDGSTVHTLIHSGNHTSYTDNKYLRSDTSDTFTGSYLAFPTLHLGIANNNSTNGYNTYFRGNNTHFVLGLANGNTLYMNYGNSSGTMRTYGTMNHEGNTWMNTSRHIYSPIYYDDDNTGYYVNPNGLTRVNTINVGSNALTGSTTYPLGVSNGQRYQIGFQNSSASENGYYPWLAHDDWNGSAAILHFNGIGDKFRFSRLGIGQADNDWRAPIFYDSNNTAYYCDPASASNLNDVTASAFIGPLYREDNRVISPSELGSGRMRFGFGSFGNNNTSPWSSHLHMRSYTDSSGGNDLLLVFKKANPSKVRLYSQTYGSSTAYSSYIDLIDTSTDAQVKSGYFQSNDSLRAPIFYDSNNTNYYVDPSATSIITYLGRAAHQSGLMVGGYNNIGASNAATNPIFTIGSNYLPNETSLGNMYGIGYTRGDASFCPGTNGWGMYVAADGDARIFLDAQNGGIGTALNSWRSPIFYDSNNTGYYSDPAGTTNLWDLQAYRIGVTNSNSETRYGISLYGGAAGGEPTYGLLFTGTSLGTHGSVTGSWATYFTMNNDNTRGWIFRRVGSGNCASISGGGTASFNGDVIAYYSDMRLKNKLGDIEDPIGKIQALNGFYYEPNEVAESYGYEKETRVGLSAQEVEAVLPEIVTDAPIGDGYKTVDYAKLVPVLVEAIKEQQKQIDELKKLINP